MFALGGLLLTGATNQMMAVTLTNFNFGFTAGLDTLGSGTTACPTSSSCVIGTSASRTYSYSGFNMVATALAGAGQNPLLTLQTGGATDTERGLGVSSTNTSNTPREIGTGEGLVFSSNNGTLYSVSVGSAQGGEGFQVWGLGAVYSAGTDLTTLSKTVLASYIPGGTYTSGSDSGDDFATIVMTAQGASLYSTYGGADSQTVRFGTKYAAYLVTAYNNSQFTSGDVVVTDAVFAGSPTSATPEPASTTLLGGALVALALVRRKL
jgi:hypothetical protein